VHYPGGRTICATNASSTAIKRVERFEVRVTQRPLQSPGREGHEGKTTLNTRTPGTVVRTNGETGDRRAGARPERGEPGAVPSGLSLVGACGVQAGGRHFSDALQPLSGQRLLPVGPITIARRHVDRIQPHRRPDAGHEPCAEHACIEASHGVSMDRLSHPYDRLDVSPRRERVLAAAAGGEDRSEIALLRQRTRCFVVGAMAATDRECRLPGPQLREGHETYAGATRGSGCVGRRSPGWGPGVRRSVRGEREPARDEKLEAGDSQPEWPRTGGTGQPANGTRAKGGDGVGARGQRSQWPLRKGGDAEGDDGRPGGREKGLTTLASPPDDQLISFGNETYRGCRTWHKLIVFPKAMPSVWVFVRDCPPTAFLMTVGPQNWTRGLRYA